MKRIASDSVHTLPTESISQDRETPNQKVQYDAETRSHQGPPDAHYAHTHQKNRVLLYKLKVLKAKAPVAALEDPEGATKEDLLAKALADRKGISLARFRYKKRLVSKQLSKYFKKVLKFLCSHVGLNIIICIYLIIGALIFPALEQNYERKVREDLDGTTSLLAEKLQNSILDISLVLLTDDHKILNKISNSICANIDDHLKNHKIEGEDDNAGKEGPSSSNSKLEEHPAFVDEEEFNKALGISENHKPSESSGEKTPARSKRAVLTDESASQGSSSSTRSVEEISAIYLKNMRALVQKMQTEEEPARSAGSLSRVKREKLNKEQLRAYMYSWSVNNKEKLQQMLMVQLTDFQFEVYRQVKSGWDGQSSSTATTQWTFSSALLYALTAITTIGAV